MLRVFITGGLVGRIFMGKVKYGLYVETTARNYMIALSCSFVYFIFLALSIIQYSPKFLLVSPFFIVFFYRFMEYKLTGVFIQFLFSHLTGNLGKIGAYSSLLTSIGAIIFFWII